jgi:hypothetical protein
MDTPSDKYKPYYGDRSGPFLAVFRSIKGLFRKLTGLFKVSEEDLSDAGIYLGGEGRDG